MRGPARDRLFTLHGWRERMAQAMDTPPFKVLGNRQLVLLADDPPADLEALSEIEGIGPRAVRRWGRDLVSATANPNQAPPRVNTPRPPNPPPEVRNRLKKLMAARDARAKGLGLQEGLLCSRSCAEAVAARQPRCSSMSDLKEAGLAGWRLEVLGAAFLEALAAD